MLFNDGNIYDSGIMCAFIFENQSFQSSMHAALLLAYMV